MEFPVTNLYELDSRVFQVQNKKGLEARWEKGGQMRGIQNISAR